MRKLHLIIALSGFCVLLLLTCIFYRPSDKNVLNQIKKAKPESNIGYSQYFSASWDFYVEITYYDSTDETSTDYTYDYTFYGSTNDFQQFLTMDNNCISLSLLKSWFTNELKSISSSYEFYYFNTIVIEPPMIDSNNNIMSSFVGDSFVSTFTQNQSFYVKFFNNYNLIRTTSSGPSVLFQSGNNSFIYDNIQFYFNNNVNGGLLYYYNENVSNSISNDYVILLEKYNNLLANYEILLSQNQILYNDKIELQNTIKSLQNQIDSLNNDLKNSYQNGYNAGLNVGQKEGFEKTGFKNLILSILNFPIDFVKTVFNFEIFGINFSNLIMFGISISIVGLVIKFLI